MSYRVILHCSEFAAGKVISLEALPRSGEIIVVGDKKYQVLNLVHPALNYNMHSHIKIVISVKEIK